MRSAATGLMEGDEDRFYRGLGPPLVGVTPMFAVSFWVRTAFLAVVARLTECCQQGYAMGKNIVYSMTPTRTSKSLTNAELAFAGFFSAVPTTLVAAPVERVKVLLQVRSSSSHALLCSPDSLSLCAIIDARTRWSAAVQWTVGCDSKALRSRWTQIHISRNGSYSRS